MTPFFIQQDPAIERKKRLAEAMMQRGQDASPIRHWTQGAARLADSMLGAYNLKKADKEMQGRQDAYTKTLSAALGSGIAQGETDGVNPGSDQLLKILSGNPDTAPLALQFKLSQMTKGPAKRNIVKGADGFNYYEDTKERVLPGVKENPEDNKKDFDKEKGLRGEFQEITKDFRKQQDAFGRVVASAKDPSAAGDLALIFNYMKILDPGSVVRESEFATAAASGSFGERIKAAANRIASGERLSPDMRADFVNRSKALYEEAAMSFDKRREQYQGLASSYGTDPGRVVSSERLYNQDSYADLGKIQPGDVDSGYEFLGGDPRDPKNWKLIEAPAK